MTPVNRHRWIRILMTFIVLAATASCTAGPSSGGTLTILTPWTDGAEKAGFQELVNTFRAKNPGIHVSIAPTRAADQVLQTDVQQGDTPDLAVMPNPGVLDAYVRQNELVPFDRFKDASLRHQLLNELKQDYAPQWYGLEEAGRTSPYAAVIKANVKSLVWYDPRSLREQPPRTWSQLLALDATITATGVTPWCLALSDPPNSGYPGTDWIEDILLSRSSPAKYRDWVDGRLSWTSPEVVDAWRTWGRIIATPGQVHGGRLTALLTNYSSGDYPLFAVPPGCYLSHGALVSSDHPVQVGTDYDFFTFPTDRRAKPAYEVSGDLMGVFHDSPAAEKLITFLAGPAGQSVWPSEQHDQAFSPDLKVAGELTGAYTKDKVAGRVYHLLTSAGATLCFDASDLMPDTMTTAFYRAVLEYVQDPGNLMPILRQLDKVQAGAYAGRTSSTHACGR